MRNNFKLKSDKNHPKISMLNMGINAPKHKVLISFVCSQTRMTSCVKHGSGTGFTFV